MRVKGGLATVLATMTCLAIVPTLSNAVSPAVVAGIVAIGKRMSDMGNGSDGRMLILQMTGAHCGPPKGHSTPRSTTIAQNWRAIQSAGRSGDADAIVAAAQNMQATLGRSSMFQKCFNSMQGSAEAASLIVQILELNSSGGPTR